MLTSSSMSWYLGFRWNGSGFSPLISVLLSIWRAYHAINSEIKRVCACLAGPAG